MEQLQRELSAERMTLVEATVAQVGESIARLEQWYAGWRDVKQSKEAELLEMKEKIGMMQERLQKSEEEKLGLESTLQEEVRCREKMVNRTEKSRCALDTVLQEEENLSDAAQACEANRESCQKDQEVRQQRLKDGQETYEAWRTKFTAIQIEKKAQIANESEGLDRMEARISSAKAEVENKRQQAVQLQDQAERFTAEWSVQEKTISDAREELAAKERLIALSKERVQAIQARLEAARAEKSAVLDEDAALKERLCAIRIALKETEDTKDLLESEIRQDEELQNAEKALKEARKADADAKLEHIKNDIMNLENKIAVRVARVDVEMHEKAMLVKAVQEKQDEIQLRTREKDNLATELRAVRTELDALLAVRQIVLLAGADTLLNYENDLRRIESEIDVVKRRRETFQAAIREKEQIVEEKQTLLDEMVKARAAPKSKPVAAKPAVRKEIRAPSLKPGQQDPKQSKPGQFSTQSPLVKQPPPQFAHPEKLVHVRPPYKSIRRVQREPSIASTESEYIDLPAARSPDSRTGREYAPTPAPPPTMSASSNFDPYKSDPSTPSAASAGKRVPPTPPNSAAKPQLVTASARAAEGARGVKRNRLEFL